MNKKKSIKYSKEVSDFICGKIEGGLCVADMVKKYGPGSRKVILPTSATIYRWRRLHDDFKHAYDVAYQTFIYGKIDEMYTLMNEPTPTLEQIKKATGDEDPHPNIIKAYISSHIAKNRLKIDTLKFIAAKLAPKLVPELSDKVNVKHELDGQIQIVLPDWGITQPPNATKYIDVRPEKEDEKND